MEISLTEQEVEYILGMIANKHSIETVLVTAKSGTTLTVTRGYVLGLPDTVGEPLALKLGKSWVSLDKYLNKGGYRGGR